MKMTSLLIVLTIGAVLCAVWAYSSRQAGWHAAVAASKAADAAFDTLVAVRAGLTRQVEENQKIIDSLQDREWDLRDRLADLESRPMSNIDTVLVSLPVEVRDTVIQYIDRLEDRYSVCREGWSVCTERADSLAAIIPLKDSVIVAYSDALVAQMEATDAALEAARPSVFDGIAGIGLPSAAILLLIFAVLK